jgi:hypothetical protein
MSGVDPTTAQILAVDEPRLANALITWRYHELAVAMAERLGGAPTWCAFGTWASRTAGRSIRGELLTAEQARLAGDIAAAVDASEVLAANRWLRFVRRSIDVDVLHDFARRVADRAARVVFRGNRLVFAELAPRFTDFCETFDGRPPSASVAEAFLARTTSGRSGMSGLDRALMLYVRALGMGDDPRQRAQTVCLANLEAVRHEQVRLDRDIEAALHAPTDELAGELGRLALDGLPAPVRWLARLVFKPRLRAVVDAVSPPLEALATEHLMHFQIAALPELALGDDLPPVREGSPFLPADLQPPRSAELDDFLARNGRSLGDGRRTAAGAWASLADRMNFITALFCSRYDLPDLLDPPFAEQQVATLRQGELPPDLP